MGYLFGSDLWYRQSFSGCVCTQRVPTLPEHQQRLGKTNAGPMFVS